jgi:hypothetical protein
MVSIGGATTEDSADPELIVSFGVCLVCPLTAQLCILVLESHPHFVCRVQEDPIVEPFSQKEKQERAIQSERETRERYTGRKRMSEQ